MRKVARKEDVCARPAFGPPVTTLVEKLPFHNVEGFVFPLMHVERRSMFWRDNSLKDDQASRSLPPRNDGSDQIAEDIPSGKRPGLVAQRQYKLPQ